MSEPEFRNALTRAVLANANNAYGPENWDADRFGPYRGPPETPAPVEPDRLLASIEPPIDNLASVYEQLGDDDSRAVLVEVLAYRLMGPHKVKLRANTPAYWSRRRALQSLFRGDETIDIDFLGMKLNRMALEAIGYPIELYFVPLGAMNTFVQQQYAYSRRSPPIEARAGDYVIDGGGCYGDTALYFANNVGARGRVASFEFAPANVAIHHQNVDLNAELSPRIELVPRALWDTSGEVFHYRPFGPATRVRDGQAEASEGSLSATTVSIDDFVRERAWPRVDFIKMDIEGAELRALKGAEHTLRAFAPTLAISIYHRSSDFVDIPNYVQGLGLGYELFIDHCTIYGEETVLFAVRPDQIGTEQSTA
jgi:FkbM family methyltransferase